METKANTRASSQQVRPQITAEGECVTAELVEGGVAKGPICVADAQGRGLTIVDLTDTWTPTLFQPTRDGQTPTFRQRYLDLAQEKIEKTETGIEALAELYGIVPGFAIVRARLSDDARHICHASIDASKVLLLDQTYSQDNQKVVKAAINGHAWLGKQLEAERAKRKLADVAELEADPKWHERYIRWKKLDELHTALLTAQAKLRCEGWLLDKDVSGEFGWRMGDAVEHFQRRNFLMPTERLDKETREAMQLDSRELDFRLALRVLRERVVEASGILEDGTAGDGPQPVLGRMLDPPAMRAARGHKPLPNAAPDLVNASTEAAAKALGWTGPNEVRAF
ncbi:MAG TPA: peptidoglycan-binding domain-containing protein, partial [Kofleriaceae bacterium]